MAITAQCERGYFGDSCAWWSVLGGISSHGLLTNPNIKYKFVDDKFSTFEWKSEVSCFTQVLELFTPWGPSKKKPTSSKHLSKWHCWGKMNSLYTKVPTIGTLCVCPTVNFIIIFLNQRSRKKWGQCLWHTVHRFEFAGLIWKGHVTM